MRVSVRGGTEAEAGANGEARAEEVGLRLKLKRRPRPRLTARRGACGAAVSACS